MEEYHFSSVEKSLTAWKTIIEQGGRVTHFMLGIPEPHHVTFICELPEHMYDHAAQLHRANRGA